MFVFRLFETVCQCLEVLMYVCALRGRVGVHMCATMIATPHLGKTNTSRDPYISSCREVLQTGVKYIYPPTAFFFPIWDYKVVRLCQESSRCSAEGVRAVCVRKKAKICDSRVKWVGVGK